MSDLRAPGNPGGTRGKSLPQQNFGPVTEDGDEGSETPNAYGSGVVPTPTPNLVSGKKGNPVK